MPITQTENKLLNELVKDCITYRLEEKEALKYIQIRFKQISLSSYKHRKARVLSEDANQIWLNHITRIGIVQHHGLGLNKMEKIGQIPIDTRDQLIPVDTERRVYR